MSRQHFTAAEWLPALAAVVTRVPALTQPGATFHPWRFDIETPEPREAVGLSAAVELAVSAV